MDNKYIRLLKKYSKDKDLLELIDLCILDDKNVREIFYEQTGNYPNQRDLLLKLKIDLCKNLND